LKKSNEIKYTNEHIGKIKIMHDFLPNLDNLVMKKEKAKVTLSITKDSQHALDYREKHEC
jgi:hypothetical protein